MAKSLETRFNGHRDEVLQDIEFFGYFYAMDKWGVKDYLAITRWAEGKTNNPNFGRSPKFAPSCGEDLGQQILNAMLSYISRSNDAKAEMKSRIEFLEGQLRLKSIENRNKAIPLLEACRA